jgi:hypothetical protein
MHVRFQSLAKEVSMPNIVAGSFEDQNLADHAVDALRAAGFGADAIMTFSLDAHARRGGRPPLGPKGAADGAMRRAAGRGLGPDAGDVDLPPPPERTEGVMLAVHAPEPSAQECALRMLVTEGARDLETADGTWRDGCWVDFDPIGPPMPVDQAEAHRWRSRR